MVAINAACKAKGGAHATYSCKVVSWDDVSRGTVGSSGLSCWGANITDTYLKSEDGAQLFTVRSDNWNEKLGRVGTDEICVVTGNQEPGGKELQPITLRDFLKQGGTHGGYAGLGLGTDLSDDELDQNVSIRFQTTFLPVRDSQAERPTIQFATEAYNYNTRDDTDPRNLLLLCTTQGLALQQDGKGAKRVFHHAVDPDGSIHRYWLEAEQSDHKVGGAQRESKAEKQDALARGKATAAVIGTRAMGTRFNVLMTIQIPLQQKPKRPQRASAFMQWCAGVSDDEDGCSDSCSDASDDEDGCSDSCSDASEDEDGCSDFSSDAPEDEEGCLMDGGTADLMSEPMGDDLTDLMSEPVEAAPNMAGAKAMTMRGAKKKAAAAPLRKGKANAARVSRGTEVDTWHGLSVKAPERNRSEHITVTVVIYNTVAGGVPSAEDVEAAVDDMEALYAACGASGRLADVGFDFMKSELTVNDAQQIAEKIKTQPYTPPSLGVVGGDVFPSGM